MPIGPYHRAVLNNGIKMPFVGMGTYKIPPGNESQKAVIKALKAGYRSIDTATYYGNEKDVGIAIKNSRIDREDIFLTTKMWIDELGYKKTHKAIDDSLSRLSTDYIDLYLIHWPRKGLINETWVAMEEIYASGQAKAIGISNFMRPHIEELLGNAHIIPAINQIEFHPYLVQNELLEYCNKMNIRIEAWSPLAHGLILDDPHINALATKYNKSASQIVLRWELQHDIITIPKSIHFDRLKENMDIFDFELSIDDMELIDLLNIPKRVGPDPFLVYLKGRG